MSLSGGANARRDFSVAIHEAAHAVVFHLLGVQVLYVTIQPNRHTLGHVTPIRKQNLEHLEALIIGGFAGDWATKLFTDYRRGEFRHSSADSRLIDRDLRRLAPDRFARNILRQTLKAYSAGMVLANEANIRTVADFLIKNKHFGNKDCSWEASELLNQLLRRDTDSGVWQFPAPSPPLNPPICPTKKCSKSTAVTNSAGLRLFKS